MKTNEILSNGSRRAFLQLSAAATAAMAFRIATEATLAAEDRKTFHPGAVVIDANENPLGPCDAAQKAIGRNDLQISMRWVGLTSSCVRS